MGLFFLGIYALCIARAAVSTMGKVTESAFFVNNRSSSAWDIGLSIVVSCVGASATIGMVGLAFEVGTPAFWWLGGGAFGLSLLALLVAKKVRAVRAYTMPQLVEHFLSPSARPLVSILVVIAWIAILAAQFVAITKVLWALTGLAPFLCSGIGFMLIVGHTFGGLAAVMRTDRIQTIIMIGGLVLLLTWLTAHNPQWIGAVAVEAVNDNFPPERFFYFLIIVGANYLVCPTLFNRFLSAKDTGTARLGGLVAVGGLLFTAILIVSVGLACKGLLPVGTKADDILTTALVQVLPPWLNYGISIALVSTIVSSADSCLITVSTVLCHDILKVTRVATIRLCVLGFGCLGLVISLWNKSILEFLFMAYDVYACGVVMPVFIGILLKDRFDISPHFACAAIIMGGISGGFASLSGLSAFSYIGMITASILVLLGARKTASGGIRNQQYAQSKYALPPNKAILPDNAIFPDKAILPENTIPKGHRL